MKTLPSVSKTSFQKKSKKCNRRRYNPYKTTLYEQYLADSGSSSSDDESQEALEEISFFREHFTVGMDINILIHQTLHNVIQSVCLDGSGGRSFCFDDTQLMCFAAAVKNNSSFLSIQIKFVDVTDYSLVPLCEALHSHPTLRALDICGTQGSFGTSRALRNLVCNNSNIIFAKIEETVLSPFDAALINEAVQYNAMVCPDPTSNPFHLGLLRKFSELEEKEKKYIQKLEPQPWMFSSLGEEEKVNEDPYTSFGHPTFPNEDKERVYMKNRKKNKLKAWRHTTESKIGAEVCPHFLKGGCPYGSRCKFFHPEYSTALSNAVKMSLYESHQHNNLREGHQMEGKKGGPEANQETASVVWTSTGTSSSAAGSRRLQSRLRPSHFTLNTHRLHNPIIKVKSSTFTRLDNFLKDEKKEKKSFAKLSFSPVFTLWTAAACIVVCTATLSIYS